MSGVSPFLHENRSIQVKTSFKTVSEALSPSICRYKDLPLPEEARDEREGEYVPYVLQSVIEGEVEGVTCDNVIIDKDIVKGSDTADHGVEGYGTFVDNLVVTD